MSCSCRVLECAICTTSYTRSMIIKSATPQELLQNDSVRELVEAANNFLDKDDAGYLLDMDEALKKFEVKE